MVQFAWWDFTIPGHVEAAMHLVKLQQEGKIRYLSVTNYDARHLKELLDAGISIVSNQVQYSLLDHRPEKDLMELTKENNIQLLCYGVLAGGFLSDRYINSPEPEEPFENRSLTKYKLIIDEFGGYDKFRQLLESVRQIAQNHNVGIAEIAARYILDKPGVAGIIVGARNCKHIHKLQRIAGISLNENQNQNIQSLLSSSKGPSGPVYALERDKKGKHGKIMKYNLNDQRNK